tara:strand:+ start:9747 stop:10226 length:480 start_codon:yes stop_codon:yes gene_type:complete
LKRVWNITNPAIHSLISFDKKGNLNANICSYVSVISLKPKLYMIAIDKKSKTHSNLLENDFSILQVLSRKNISLIKILGKKSGRNLNKFNYLLSKRLLGQWNKKNVIKDSCGIIFLNKINVFDTIGDHTLFVFKILKTKTISESNILTFNKLIDDKIIL